MTAETTSGERAWPTQDELAVRLSSYISAATLVAPWAGVGRTINMYKSNMIGRNAIVSGNESFRMRESFRRPVKSGALTIIGL